MESPRRPWTVAPVTAALLGLVPATLLTRCGIWPSFDPALLDAGIDARDTGAPHPDVPDAGMPDAGMPDAGMPDVMALEDAPTDTGLTTGGFRTCPTPPPAGPFAVQFAVAGTLSARDLVFDGRGTLAIGGTQLVLVDDMGMRTPVSTDAGALYIYGLNLLPDGRFVASSSGAGPTAIRAIDLSGAVSPLVPPETFQADAGMFPGAILRDVAVHPNGTVYIADVYSSRVYRIAPGSSRLETLSNVSTPTGLALTPDARQLYAGSRASQVFVIDLTADGEAMSPARVYADLRGTTATGEGIAFDECGYLYVSDQSANNIYRVAPGGTSFDPVVETRTMDGGRLSPWGMAFGRGGMFDTQSIYFVDQGSGDVYRVNVGVAGARPPSTM
jgi:hypothetical protein